MTTTEPSQAASHAPTGSDETTVYVLGGGSLGSAVVRRLRAAGRDVVLVDEAVDAPGDTGHPGDPAEVATLADAGLGAESSVIVATPSDARNLLVAQLVRAKFDVDRVVVLANHPDRVEPLADAGHEAVCATAALSEVLVDQL